jgi:hypothetical protein
MTGNIVPRDNGQESIGTAAKKWGAGWFDALHLTGKTIVTAVTASGALSSTGGETPALTIAAASVTVPGSMSAADKVKLDGIAAGAQPNPTTFTKVRSLSAIGGTLPASSPDQTAWDNFTLSNGMIYTAMNFGRVYADKFQFRFRLPDWTGGPLTFTLTNVTHGADTVGHTIIQNIAAVRVPDSSSMNVAPVALTSVTDGFIASDYQQISPPSASVTPSGTGSTLLLEITRNWATDTYTGEVHLTDIDITYPSTG